MECHQLFRSKSCRRLPLEAMNTHLADVGVSLAGLYAFCLLYYSGERPWAALALLVLVAAGICAGLLLGRGGVFICFRAMWQGTRPSDFVFGIAFGGVGYMLFSFVLSYPRLSLLGSLRRLWVAPGPLLLLICAVAACEEIFFRGYLLLRVQHRFGDLAGILCSGFAMGVYKALIHCRTLSPNEVLILSSASCSAGIVLALYVVWRHNLLCAVVAHVLYDLLVFLPWRELPPWVL